MAKEKFSQVKKEYNRSEYGLIAQNKIKAIEGYSESLNGLKIYESIASDTMVLDTTLSDSIKKKNPKPLKTYEELLYHVGDLEAFSFDRLDTGIVFFKKILDNDSTSKFYPKALFTLSLLYNDIGDTIKSNNYKNILMSDFPKSDYTSYVSKGDSLNLEKRPVEILFLEAENLWTSNPGVSMNEFKKVINADTLSEVSASAAYFLGYQYDYTYAIVDSAFKYYDWLNVMHPMSEQNKLAKARVKFLKQLVQASEPDTIKTVK
jgi:tetratricopeptide (TPR) repeat protein